METNIREGLLNIEIIYRYGNGLKMRYKDLPIIIIRDNLCIYNLQPVVDFLESCEDLLEVEKNALKWIKNNNPDAQMIISMINNYIKESTNEENTPLVEDNMIKLIGEQLKIYNIERIIID